MEKMSLFTAVSLKGSFTLETAVVLPLFLFFMLTLFVFFDVQQEQDQLQETFVNTAKNMALMSYKNKEEDMICLHTMHQVRSRISFFEKKTVYGYVEVSAKPWTGEDGRVNGDGSSENGEVVYKTQTGSVYHTNPACSYLNPSIEVAASSSVVSKRNENGEIYRPCESCKPQENGMVYITDYGNRYHGDISCSALKRTILVISKEEATGISHCSKCAAWEGMR